MRDFAYKVLFALSFVLLSSQASSAVVLSYETVTTPASNHRYHLSGDFAAGSTFDIYYTDAYADLNLDVDAANAISNDLFFLGVTPSFSGSDSVLSALVLADLSLDDAVFSVFFTSSPGRTPGAPTWDVLDASLTPLASGIALSADAEPGNTVPEPGTALLMLAGGAFLIRKKSARRA